MLRNYTFISYIESSYKAFKMLSNTVFMSLFFSFSLLARQIRVFPVYVGLKTHNLRNFLDKTMCHKKIMNVKLRLTVSGYLDWNIKAAMECPNRSKVF